MQIDKLKHQHADILARLAALRQLTHAGVAPNAPAIAAGIVGMSAVIKLHLAVEDQALYPALQRSHDADMAHMGQLYQDEMAQLAEAYDGFVRRWNTAQRLRADTEGFRADANDVLRRLHARMQRENRDFYPRIEALA